MGNFLASKQITRQINSLEMGLSSREPPYLCWFFVLVTKPYAHQDHKSDNHTKEEGNPEPAPEEPDLTGSYSGYPSKIDRRSD